MERLYVESAGTGIIYESDLPIYEYFLKHGKYLEFPGLKVMKINDDFPCNYKLIYQDSLDKSLIIDNNNLIINYPINEINESSVIYPGYILLEQARLSKMAVSCHSSCIETNDTGILLLGKTGSGKTTTAINLCKNYDFSLIANDVSVIRNTSDGIEVVNGTKFIFLREESIARNLPELLYVFKNKDVDINYRSNNKGQIDSWRNKTRVMPEELGINSCNVPTKIIKAYMLHVDENQNELYNVSDNSLVTRLYLNECLSKTIRGINTTFMDKNNNPSLYIPSLDSPKHYSFRNEIIKKIIDDCSIEYLSGNIEDVSQYINDDTKRLIRRK